MAKIVPPGSGKKTPPARRISRGAEALGHRTVLGMPAVGSDIADAKQPGEEAPPKETTPQEAPATAAGEPQPVTTQDEQPAPTAPPVEDPQKTEPMPTMDGPEASPPRQSAESSPAPPTGGFDAWPEEEDPETGRGRGILIALVIAALLAVSAAGVAVYLLVFEKRGMLTPQVFPNPGGKSVTVVLRFDEAPPGTVLQLAGQQAAVVQGQARVSIPMNQLKLGANNVEVSYTEPGGGTEQMRFPIVLRHAITDDLSGLSAESPFITISFQIAAGVGLAVEGKPAQIVNGVYHHKVTIKDLMVNADPRSDHLMHKVSFQLTGKDGVGEQGEHMVAIPITKLQIDRPADKAAVVADTLTCSGSSEEGAQVTVNGKAVGVTAVGFNTSLPLTTIGEHQITIMARAPGKAPRTRVVTVTRLESFDDAIAAWSRNLDKKLDYPTIGRDPNAHIGKKVKLNGRVVNIKAEKGVTAFILYVGEGCPAKSQCGVYVVFRGETDAGLHSWVDVYGVVRGNRAVDLQDGRKMEMPALDAEFVVKSEKSPGGSRRR
jgi:hypothetical protein